MYYLPQFFFHPPSDQLLSFFFFTPFYSFILTGWLSSPSALWEDYQKYYCYTIWSGANSPSLGTALAQVLIVSYLDDHNSLPTNVLASELSRLPIYQLHYCPASCYCPVQNPSVLLRPRERIRSSCAACEVLAHSLPCCFSDATSHYLPLVPFPLTKLTYVN